MGQASLDKCLVILENKSNRTYQEVLREQRETQRQAKKKLAERGLRPPGRRRRLVSLALFAVLFMISALLAYSRRNTWLPLFDQVPGPGETVPMIPRTIVEAPLENLWSCDGKFTNLPADPENCKHIESIRKRGNNHRFITPGRSRQS